MPANRKSNARRPLILHIASDYTDGLGEGGEIGPAHRQRRPTLAINRLVDGTDILI